MKNLAVIFVAFILSTGLAHAISRYQSTSMSCEAARSTVDREGAVVFRYPSARVPGLTLYDRFVSHGGYCSFNEYAGARSIPTADGSCTLLACRQTDEDTPFMRGFGD